MNKRNILGVCMTLKSLTLTLKICQIVVKYAILYVDQKPGQ